jgi:hypothetical protein
MSGFGRSVGWSAVGWSSGSGASIGWSSVAMDQRSAGREPPSAIPAVRATRLSFSQRVRILGAVDLPIPRWRTEQWRCCQSGSECLPQLLLGFRVWLRRGGNGSQGAVAGHDYLAVLAWVCGVMPRPERARHPVRIRRVFRAAQLWTLPSAHEVKRYIRKPLARNWRNLHILSLVVDSVTR